MIDDERQRHGYDSRECRRFACVPLRSRTPAGLLTVAMATALMLGCGGDSPTVTEQWNEICRDSSRERLRNKLVTAADFRRFADENAQALERMRDVAPTSELNDSQREALRAFAAQRGLERRFLEEMRNHQVADVALDIAKPADALARRVRTAFAVAGASECAAYSSLR